MKNELLEVHIYGYTYVIEEALNEVRGFSTESVCVCVCVCVCEREYSVILFLSHEFEGDRDMNTVG